MADSPRYTWFTRECEETDGLREALNEYEEEGIEVCFVVSHAPRTFMVVGRKPTRTRTGRAGFAT
jgi:hypothetical protein